MGGSLAAVALDKTQATFLAFIPLISPCLPVLNELKTPTLFAASLHLFFSLRLLSAAL